MLLAATAATVLLGAWLIARPHRGVGLVHGGSGAVLLLLAGWSLYRGRIAGAYAWDAVGLVGVAFALGLLMWSRRLGSATGGVLTLHAMLAGIGGLLLAGLALG